MPINKIHHHALIPISKLSKTILLSICIFSVCLWGSSLAFKGHCLQPQFAGEIPYLPQPQRTLCCSQCYVHPHATATTDY